MFDLPGFGVVSVELTPLGLRAGRCDARRRRARLPAVRVLAGGKPYDVREMRVKDLPVGHRRCW
ncbi:MAG: hypothetical protein ACXVXQ_06115 [Mycobacteriaceae bacterium]